MTSSILTNKTNIKRISVTCSNLLYDIRFFFEKKNNFKIAELAKRKEDGNV